MQFFMKVICSLLLCLISFTNRPSLATANPNPNPNPTSNSEPNPDELINELRKGEHFLINSFCYVCYESVANYADTRFRNKAGLLRLSDVWQLMGETLRMSVVSIVEFFSYCATLMSFCHSVSLFSFEIRSSSSSSSPSS